MMVRIEESESSSLAHETIYFSSNNPVCVCIMCECVCMFDVGYLCISVSGFRTIILNCMRVTVTLSVDCECEW
jgi:hypothetical protein